MKYLKKFNEEILTNNQFQLLSVKRERDGVVFSIGDKYQDTSNSSTYPYRLTIKQFTYLEDGRIIVHADEGGTIDLNVVSKIN